MNMNKTIFRAGIALLSFTLSGFAQEQWELGIAGGYGFHKNMTATNATGEATVGFKSGYAFGMVAGNEVNRWFGGEARYTFQQNDAFVKAGNTQAQFDAQSHTLNYDFIFHLTPRPARVRPFLAVGAGVKIYRGTGREAAFQPLSNFVALTRATHLTPVISGGGGFKIRLSDLMTLRIEGRDFASTFPNEVIAPVPGARANGWMHNIVPLVGLSFAVGR
jgi:Outer membrane protein beta-barrel domain